MWVRLVSVLQLKTLRNNSEFNQHWGDYDAFKQLKTVQQQKSVEAENRERQTAASGPTERTYQQGVIQQDLLQDTTQGHKHTLLTAHELFLRSGSTGTNQVFIYWLIWSIITDTNNKSKTSGQLKALRGSALRYRTELMLLYDPAVR